MKPLDLKSRYVFILIINASHCIKYIFYGSDVVNATSFDILYLNSDNI